MGPGGHTWVLMLARGRSLDHLPQHPSEIPINAFIRERSVIWADRNLPATLPDLIITRCLQGCLLFLLYLLPAGFWLYADCRARDSHYADCRARDSHDAGCRAGGSLYADCRARGSLYADCWAGDSFYDDCRARGSFYADCRLPEVLSMLTVGLGVLSMLTVGCRRFFLC